MKGLRSKLLAGLTVQAIALCLASPAMGQDAAAVESGDQAREPEAAATAATAAEPASENAIVVTGYRASLENAQAVKRRAPVVMEAITPQDLGKFTDSSISDQLQRVPGVQVDRDNDGRSGDHVSIRGMGPQFITTTFNGRTPAGYGREGLQYLRMFATDVLPSEIMGGVQIYKSSSAEMPEAGLGGEVNFDTLRPLDYRAPNGANIFGNITVKGTSNNYTSEWGKGISGAIGGKFFDDTIGIVIAGVKNDAPFKRWDYEIRPNQVTVNVQRPDNTVQQQSVLFPSQTLVESIRGTQKRTAISSDIQWRPNENLEINLDYTYSRLDKPTVWDVLDIGYNSGGTFLPGGITIEKGGVIGLDYSKYSGGSGIAFGGLYPYQYRNDAELTMRGANVKWHNDSFFVAVDGFQSKTDTLMSANFAWIPLLDSAIPANNLINYSTNVGLPAIVNAGAPSLGNPSNFSTTFYPGQRYIVASHDVTSLRLDFGANVNDNITLKAGVRYNEGDVDTRDILGNSSATAAQLRQLFPAYLPGAPDCIFPGTKYAFCQPFQDPLAAAAINNAFIAPADLNAAPFGGPFSGVTTTQAGTWNISSIVSHANVEKTKAAYAQMDFKGLAGKMDFEGNVGVRVVKTTESAQALQSVSYVDLDNQTTRPISFGIVTETNSYTNVLPSANLTLHPSHDVNVRLAATKSLSRPEFEDMSPTNAIGIPDPQLATTTPSSVGIARIGNINLKPMTAWNFDLTVEKYTPSGGSFVVSLFYKAVKDFVVSRPRPNATIDGYGSQGFNITSAENSSTGRAYGAELGFHQPLSVLSDALDGFGVQANYTYVDTQVDEPIDGLILPFLGASKHNANGALYYSKGKLDARIAASYRSSYLSQVPWGGTRPVYLFTEGSTSLDASISYAVTENFDITVTGSNLTKQDRRDFAPNNMPMLLNYITAPRVIAIALRAKL